jgi:hypothetical protein
MNSEKIHARWKQFWATLGIRHLGMEPDDFIPTPKDRAEYGYKNGFSEGYAVGEAEGRLQAYEISIAILDHQFQHLKTFFGKDHDTTLMVANILHSIREAQGEDLEKAEPQQPDADE